MITIATTVLALALGYAYYAFTGATTIAGASLYKICIGAAWASLLPRAWYDIEVAKGLAIFAALILFGWLYAWSHGPPGGFHGLAHIILGGYFIYRQEPWEIIVGALFCVMTFFDAMAIFGVVGMARGGFFALAYPDIIAALMYLQFFVIALDDGGDNGRRGWIHDFARVGDHRIISADLNRWFFGGSRALSRRDVQKGDDQEKAS